MYSFQQIEHTADIAYIIQGDSLEELFTGAFKAWQNSAASFDMKTETAVKNFTFKCATYEELLVEFLSEINYLLLSKLWLSFEINGLILRESDEKTLTIYLSGNYIEKIFIKEEIKAVTYHQLEIKKLDNKYQTTLVFDI